MAAGSTYTPIASQTLGSAAASITFSSIPSTYTDLVLIYGGAGTAAGQIDLRVGNGSVDAGNNYSTTILYGDGTSAGSLRYSNAAQANIGYTDASQTNNITHLMNYANTTTYKTILSRGSQPATSANARVSLWRSTSAINIITIYAGAGSGGTFIAGSTFTLYGIAAA